MPQLLHIAFWSVADCKCIVCSTLGDRKIIKFKCSTCNAYLHPKDCFLQESIVSQESINKIKTLV